VIFSVFFSFWTLFAGGEGLGSFSTFLEGKKEKGLSLCLQSNHCAIFKNQNKTKKDKYNFKNNKKTKQQKNNQKQNKTKKHKYPKVRAFQLVTTIKRKICTPKFDVFRFVLRTRCTPSLAPLDPKMQKNIVYKTAYPR